MSVTRTKFITVKGCAVWAADDRGTPIYDHPQVDNTTITAPSIEFGTTDVNMMGTLSIPDFTKIDNFSLTVSIPVDNPDAQPLKRIGLQRWIISYVVANLNTGTGLEELTGYRIYATGYVTNVPSAEISVGSEGKADLSMNLVSYKKWPLGGTAEYDIDRSTGKIEINGVNYSSEQNSLY